MNIIQLQDRLEDFRNDNDFETLKEFKGQLEALQFKDFDKFINFDDERYCKNSIFKSKDFEIILICWKPFQKTSNHFHPENGCLMKILKGELTETRIVVNQKDTTSIYNKGDVTFIKAAEAHTIENSKYHSISLHIYSPSGFYDVNKKLKNRPQCQVLDIPDVVTT